MSAPIRALLLDFDGVIAQNSFDLLVEAFERYLATQGLVAPGLVRDFCRVIGTPLPVRDSMGFLCAAFGVPCDAQLIAQMQASILGRMRIDPALPALRRACAQRSVVLRIASAASWQVLAQVPGIDAEMKLTVPQGSKADPAYFHAVLAQIASPPHTVLLVDDSPQVLRAAKIAGLQTAFMRGPLFGEADLARYGAFIDRRCRDLAEVLSWIGGGEP